MFNPKHEKQKGLKHDAGKPPVELVPYELVAAAARGFGYGEFKYTQYDRSGAQNWRKGIPTRKLLGSCIRHLMKWAGGEEWDKDAAEKGYRLHHLDCAAASLAMLIATLQNKPDMDNRGFDGGTFTYDDDEIAISYEETGASKDNVRCALHVAAQQAEMLREASREPEPVIEKTDVKLHEDNR